MLVFFYSHRRLNVVQLLVVRKVVLRCNSRSVGSAIKVTAAYCNTPGCSPSVKDAKSLPADQAFCREVVIDVHHLDPQGVECSPDELCIELRSVKIEFLDITTVNGLSIIPVSNDTFFIRWRDVGHN